MSNTKKAPTKKVAKTIYIIGFILLVLVVGYSIFYISRSTLVESISLDIVKVEF